MATPVRLVNKKGELEPCREYSNPGMGMPRLIQYDNRIFKWTKTENSIYIYEEQ